MKEAVVKSYGNKGEKVVSMNHAAIDRGITDIQKVTVPAEWGSAEDACGPAQKVPPFIENVLQPVNRQEGDKLPVSAFVSMEDGSYPAGTSAFEKRGIAIHVPAWQTEKCIQCNQCSYVCPHAAIRPMLLTGEEVQKAPAGFNARQYTGKKDLYFSIAVSPYDCTGCGNCAQVCPAREKALVMQPLDSQLAKDSIWKYAMTLSPKENPMSPFTVKGS